MGHTSPWCTTLAHLVGSAYHLAVLYEGVWMGLYHLAMPQKGTQVGHNTPTSHIRAFGWGATWLCH